MQYSIEERIDEVEFGRGAGLAHVLDPIGAALRRCYQLFLMAAPGKEPDLAGSAPSEERRPQLPQLLLKRDHLIGLSLNSIEQLFVRPVLPQITEGPNRRNGQLAEFSRDRFGLIEVCPALFDGFLAEHLPPPPME
jgi:hypothetical protein